MDDFAQLTARQLLSVLDTGEDALGNGTRFERYAHRAGQLGERVSPHVVALAERDLLTAQLRSRTTVPHRG